MNSYRRVLRRITAIAAAVVALTGMSAASASAAVFSPEGEISYGGEVTWTVEGGPSYACAMAGKKSVAQEFIDLTVVGSSSFNPACKKTMAGFNARASSNASGEDFISITRTYSPTGIPWMIYSPYGTVYFYTEKVVPQRWVDGNALTPSRIEFENAYVGRVARIPGQPTQPYEGKIVRLTGSLNVTTASGGLVVVE